LGKRDRKGTIQENECFGVECVTYPKTTRVGGNHKQDLHAGFAGSGTGRIRVSWVSFGGEKLYTGLGSRAIEGLLHRRLFLTPNYPLEEEKGMLEAVSVSKGSRTFFKVFLHI
jgi:hypothetical protein